MPKEILCVLWVQFTSFYCSYIILYCVNVREYLVSVPFLSAHYFQYSQGTHNIVSSWIIFSTPLLLCLKKNGLSYNPINTFNHLFNIIILKLFGFKLRLEPFRRPSFQLVWISVSYIMTKIKQLDCCSGLFGFQINGNLPLG